MLRLFAFATAFCSTIFFVTDVSAANNPANDDCSSATQLSLGITDVTGTLKSATSSGVAIGTCTGNPDDDVWFSIALTSPQGISISLSNVGSSLLSGERIQLFSGSCNSLTSVACGTSTLLSSVLTSGTYYIRVFSSGSTVYTNNADFDITVTGAPANNDCLGAITLTSGISCTNTSGTLYLSSVSSGMPSGCAGSGSHYDVWYSFVAANTSETITLSSLGTNITNPELQLFSGACASLTSFQCGTTLIAATGLTIGTTYYVRVSNVGSDPSSTGSSTFNICVTHPQPPPSNDDCSGAVSLTVGTTNSSGTVYGATASSSIPAGCASGSPDDDVWYKFTATSTTATITLSSLGSNLSAAGALLQLFSGSCASLSSISCGYTSLSTSALTIGNTYYVRVYSSTSGSIGGTSTGSTFSITVSNASIPSSVTVTGSRMNEVFKLTTISTANNLNYPWEVTYGPDGYLWITESRGYKVVRMDPNTGLKNTVLDISLNSPFLPSASQGFNLQFDFGGKGNPQGGLAGMALHPLFLDPVTPKNYVYVSYIHTWISGSSSLTDSVVYVNRLVRFEYNTTTGFLQNPVSLCDTLPGSSDHNSQRMIIAPVGGIDYLFYASGDMGAGQYSNQKRIIRAQDQNSYQGKILRFNLESDGDANEWIPNDNPFGSSNAVWATGIRNNQGFAYGTINGVGYLYGTSHGPFSDDEVNIIEKGKNYGHPLVIGYSTDGNYDGAKAGPSSGSLPLITSEAANATAIGSSYKDPIFCFYPALKGNTSTTNTIQYIYGNNISANGGWPSEAPSGLGVYTNTIIPGWKNSLISAALKWGRLVRLKLNDAGTGVQSINGQDTATYFENPNRYRDMAFSPDGKDMYVVMDNQSATSGPGTENPSIVNCAGCVHKYTFLGYSNNSSTGRSTIPNAIDITTTTDNTITSGTSVTIDATNNNLWVPITGPDGNIMAEIKANGNNLGAITSSFYTSASARETAAKKLYLNRSMTITPQVQPTSTVNVRLYITAAELTALKTALNSQGAGSGVSGISDLRIFKNSDANPSVMTASATTITPTYAEAHPGTSNGGYVLQADITSFSSFYFGSASLTTLPVTLLQFKGSIKDEATILQWQTTNELNAAHFEIERSTDGASFDKIGLVAAKGNSSVKLSYSFTDEQVANQSATTIYYRLKMVDKDGAFKYSEIVSVIFEPLTGVNVYPNPIEDVLNIRFTAQRGDNVVVQVSDIQGRVIYTEAKQIHTGTNNLKIATKAWPSQSYTIQVMGSDKKVLLTKKAVKM